MLPRGVVIERATEFRELLKRHGTREQARFFLAERSLDLGETEERHLHYQQTRARVLGLIPGDWRVATVQRAELDRFLFAADDVVIVLGQDGLVANVAKYLDSQPVIGLNPEVGHHPGVLVRHRPEALADLCADLLAGRDDSEHRTMVQASLDDGQRLLALNELFVGHASHQSARYTIQADGRQERQSSSGVIIATGTGATGWASSINRAYGDALALPKPTAGTLAWFVREAWGSPATGTELTSGLLDVASAITVTSELTDGAVAFGDGIETDRLSLDWGQRLTVRVADTRLRLLR